MIFNFFKLAYTASDSYTELVTTLKQKIAKLHSMTKFATFYEFFNLNENCSESDIKKAFRKLKKSEAPKGMSKSQFDELIMYGYSLLVNYRKAYDGFLRDSKFFYIDEAVNYKNYIIVIMIAVIFFLIFLDFLYYSFKYLKYLEMSTNAIKKKDDNANVSKKNQKQLYLNPPAMVTSRIYNSATKIFSRKQ